MKKKAIQLAALLLSVIMVITATELSTFSVQAAGTTNLALNKTPFSDAAYYDNVQWNLASLTDGKKLNTSASGTNDGYHSMGLNNPTNLGVDLGAVTAFNTVTLYPRIDNQTSGALVSYVVDFSIDISSDKANWTTVKTVTGNTNPNRDPQDFTFATQNAQYVRISVTKTTDSSNTLALAELEIYNNLEEEAPAIEYTAQILNETFDGTALDTNKWASSTGGASITGNNWVANNAGNDLRFKTKIPTDMAVEYDLELGSVTGDYWVGMMFGKTNIGDTWDNGCPMLFIRGNGQWTLYNVAGSGTISGLTGSTVVHVKVETQGETIRVYINDVLATTQVKSGFVSGYISFYTNAPGGTTAYLDNIKVSVPQTTTTQEVADGIVVKNPYIDDTKLALPTVPSGFEVNLVSSSNPDVISLSGVVTPPQAQTAVEVVLQIKDLYTEETINKTVTYTVPAKTDPASIEDFQNMKYGLFVHYVWAGQRRIGLGGQPEEISASYPDGTPAKTIDEMIENFDAVQFAQDCKDSGMQYVVFTVWHYGMNPVYPSQVYKDWRTHETGDLPTDDGQHDLIDKVYQALHDQGIDLYLYTHPYDIHDMYQEDKTKFDYKYNGDLTFNYDLYNDYLNAQYKELCERYKGKIKGMFFDEGLANPANNLSVDYARLRDTVKSVDPSFVMIQNEYNGKYTCDTSMWELPTAWHGGQYNNLTTWQTNTIPMGTTIGNIYQGYSWWAVKNRGAGTSGLESAENAYIYTVLEAGTNTEGGGLAWAAGPYCGNDATGIWEDGVKETLVKMYGYIKPIEQAIKNTRPSKSYVTPAYSTINTVGWGVATESPDGSSTYLHIINPPSSGKTLHIAAPADGKVFAAAKLLASGETVTMVQDAIGITLTLPQSADWDALNTVIKLTIKVYDLADLNTAIADAGIYSTKTTVGVLVGNVSQEAKDSYAAAISAAQGVADNADATPAQIDAAVKALATAKVTFDNAKIPPINLALNATVTASSSHPAGSPGALVNGINETDWGWTSDPYSPTQDKTEWVQLEFADSKNIDTITLTPRRNAGGFPIDFTIQAATEKDSNGNYNWQTVVTESGYKITDNSAQTFTFNSTRAKYIRIEATKLSPEASDRTNYRFMLNEIQAYDKTPPMITFNPYTTMPTNKDITVEATTDEGTLNADSHTFTENGSFEFVATDDAGNVSTKTVTITNIDKVAPVITISAPDVTVTYQSHVQDIGWQGWKNNGSSSGTTGQSKRLEAMNIKLENLTGGIEYRAHVQNIGWMDWVADGNLSGTTGQSKRLEAIQIRLTGNAAEQYDVYYRVHVQNKGWLDWAKNGESAGSAGCSYRMEAIQIVLVPKGGTAPGLTVHPFTQSK